MMAIQSISFEITKDEYTFKDAIVYDDSIESFTPEQILDMQQARFDAWYIVVTTPVEEDEILVADILVGSFIDGN
jgi:predicted Zn-dependent peptidase